jgi:hypothetical protein
VALDILQGSVDLVSRNVETANLKNVRVGEGRRAEHRDGT